MPEGRVPYGRKAIERIEPGPDETDAQKVDLTRSGPLAGHDRQSYHAVPPVKPAPFEIPHIPLYFWVGGIAAGAWLAATAEELGGGEDRDVVRAGRYLTLGSILAGTGLLVADLGRPERFLNMLRIVRGRSPMSLGSWALASFGAWAGAGAMLQAAEDGVFGDRPRLAGLSRGRAGTAAHLLGAPIAMFVGSYTGVLLSATATPGWAHRSRLLPALFTASASSSGLAAVTAALEAAGGIRPPTARRLARALAVSLAAESALQTADSRRAADLPSRKEESAGMRALRRAAFVLGMAAPLALAVLEVVRRDDASPTDGLPPRRRSFLRLAGAGLALAGSLATRWITVKEGLQSARTPEDTWAYAGNGRREGEHAARA